MAATLKPYLNAVRHTLTAAMCLDNFSSQVKRVFGFLLDPVTNLSLIRELLSVFGLIRALDLSF